MPSAVSNLPDKRKPTPTTHFVHRNIFGYALAPVSVAMICGYEALELEKRKPSVDIACFPDSGCGDDFDITRTAGGIA
jgi:hypothetical protein